MEEPILIGDYHYQKRPFGKIDEVFQTFYEDDFQKFSDRKRSDFVNRALLELIKKEPEPCFLLPSVLDFVERIDREDILHHYTFTSFELWLNQYSDLSFQDNFSIRGKIVGKKIPREEYQALFPIGMGKVYEGTHFVTAHKSPDLDTTVASFWGWVDAFAARVGDGLHVWNVPGGPPPSQIEIDLIFKDIFGSAVFSHLPKTRTTLTLTGNDLLTQKGMIKKDPSDFSFQLDHDREYKSMVVTDEKGYYLGDWRDLDVELIRQIIGLLNYLLRWFENSVHVNLISLFAKESLNISMVPQFVGKIFSLKLKESEPVAEYTERQKTYLNDFLTKIFGVEKGLEATFEEFWASEKISSFISFPALKEISSAIEKEKLFNEKGNLVEDRPKIFSYLEKTISRLHHAVITVRKEMDRFGIGLDIKKEILGLVPNYLTVRSDVEEMRSKMGAYQHLTVLYPDAKKFTPVGVVLAKELRKRFLGTVSLRDFCNSDEMQIPSYIEVISVIDHHKTELMTYTPPFALIGDAQSSNTLVGSQAFIINDSYSLCGMSKEEIVKQIDDMKTKSDSASSRLLERLLKLKRVVERKSSTFIHPEREFIEYLHFLYGILDDTDLLTKVSRKDVEVVAALLNRMKSFLEKKQVEIISFDDIPNDHEFANKAAKRILQNEDMYSLYKKVYAFREKEVEKNFQLCIEKKPSNLFADTKEQNGCCRVGQTKLFANNMASLHRDATALRSSWAEKAEKIHADRSELDLHLQMISTIVSADDVFKGLKENYHHKDELWIWIPQTDIGQQHLKRFLNAFAASPQLINNGLELELLGKNSDYLDQLFKESFLPIETRVLDLKIPIAVLYYKAGLINSRKAMISPYLPTLVN